MRRIVGLFVLLAVLLSPLAQAEIEFATASPESMGMDAQLLRDGVSKIENGDYGDIDSLLVLRDGKLVLEKYFKPDYFGRDYRQSVRSVSPHPRTNAR